MKALKKILFSALFLISASVSYAQELDWEKMLIEDVENINPVYMPVVGIGTGYLNFLGDVRNNVNSPFLGSMAFKANMHAYIDQPKHYKFNLYVLFTIPGDNGTSLVVNQRNYLVPDKNFRFKTDLLMFGLNVHYDFDHFIKKSRMVRPFVSVGAEFLTFNSKADLIGKYYDPKTKKYINSKYYYWTDGSVKNRPQTDERQAYNVLPDRSGDYETDMRNDTAINKPIGVDKRKNNYNQYALAIPFEAGLDFFVSNRTSIRIGYAFHWALTDYIDNVSKDNPVFGIKNKGSFDNFSYSYVSLHFDLFSDPKMLRMNRIFMDIENFDYDLIGDEDGDMIFDINDKCFRTPKGTEVDSTGCPFDTDLDGIADYQDKEMDSAPGSIVDNNGVEIPDALVWANLSQEALPRVQVELYLQMINNLSSGTGRKLGSVAIPDKFKTLDLDGDKYISFDEVLKAIDAFFDFDSELTTDDIYELNNFFFEQ